MGIPPYFTARKAIRLEDFGGIPTHSRSARLHALMKGRSLLVLAAVAALAIGVLTLLRGTPPDAPALDDPAFRAAHPWLEADEGVGREAAAGLQPGVRPASSAPPGGRWLLEGRVMDRAGLGVAGCELILAQGVWQASRPREGEASSAPLARSPDEAQVLARAVSDAIGAWRIELAHPPEADERANGGVAVVAEAPGFRDAGEFLDEATLRLGGVCEIVLVPGATVRGRVLGQDGLPIGGALVDCGWRSRRTAADGSFRVETPAEVRFQLGASHPSGTLLRTGLLVPSGVDADLGDLHLEGPGALAGSVLFPDGTPAPLLPILAVQVGYGHRPALSVTDRAGGNVIGEGRTDETGRFTIRGLRDAEYRVFAAASGVEVELARAGEEQPAAHWSMESAELLFRLPYCMLQIRAPSEPPGTPLELIVSAAPPREDAARPAETAYHFLPGAQLVAEAAPAPLLFLGPGWLRLQADADDGRTALTHLELRKDRWLYPLELRFAAAPGRGTVLVRIPDDVAAVPSLPRCSLFDPRTGRFAHAAAVESRDDGLLISGVPEGAWRLTISDAQWRPSLDFELPGVLDVEVRGGATVETLWQPERGGALEVLATVDLPAAPDGRAPELYAEVVEGPDFAGETLVFTQLDAKGGTVVGAKFRSGEDARIAAPMPAGEYLLRFHAEGCASREERIRIEVGEVARVEPRLSAAP